MGWRREATATFMHGLRPQRERQRESADHFPTGHCAEIPRREPNQRHAESDLEEKQDGHASWAAIVSGPVDFTGF
jgi:hypothetical protein